MHEHGSRTGTATCDVAAPDVFEAAVEAHRAGRLDEAAALYEQAVADDATDFAALHLLGAVCYERRDFARAAELIGRAAALRPDVAAIQAGLAEVSLAVGQFGRAAECAREALRLGADEATARCSLGQALLALGRRAEAADEARRAAALRPDSAPTHLLLGDALRALGRVDEARAAYLEAVRLAPDLAVAHAHLGLLDLSQDRFDEALPRLERAAELQPDQPAFWEYLADLYHGLKQYDGAVRCWRRVLGLAPDARARPHLALGWALQELDRLDEAEAHYLAAVAIEPGAAEAHVNLGALHLERGEFDAAEAAFRTAIRLNPTDPLPHARLANLLSGRLPDADLAALTARLDDPETDPNARARLLFGLCQVCDARGEYARAAVCAREANALNRSGRPFDPAGHERFIGALTRAFGPDFFARAAGAGLDTRRPVFVVGLPRSGTTLVEQVLASHPRVHGAGERDLGRRTSGMIPGAPNTVTSPLDWPTRLDRATIRRLAAAALDLLGSPASDRVIDKTPENALYLGLLVALFPNATVIHCRRDLRDVALSCWMTDFHSQFWANDPGHIAAKFRAHLRVMDHWRAALPATVHEVDYEETVSDLEGVARRLVAALGLDWDPACLEFHRTHRPVRTSSVTQVRQPLYTRSVARWKHYEHHLPELFAALPLSGSQ
jgi:tetratricopeptide (TPR) repeat protein